MKTILSRKTLLVTLIVALLISALPVSSALASGLDETPTPPANGRRLSNERIEKIWQRQLKGYERLGRLSEKSGDLFARADQIVTVLKGMGADTAELEAALADFEEAIKQAQPIYDSCEEIVASHKGFDENGKVTDAVQAIQTIAELGSKLREIRDNLHGKGKVVADLLKPIRDAFLGTPTPEGR